MTPDPERRIANRRRIIATLRQSADRAEETAREMRGKADQLERSTDALDDRPPERQEAQP